MEHKNPHQEIFARLTRSKSDDRRFKTFQLYSVLTKKLDGDHRYGFVSSPSSTITVTEVSLFPFFFRVATTGGVTLSEHRQSPVFAASPLHTDVVEMVGAHKILAFVTSEGQHQCRRCV